MKRTLDFVHNILNFTQNNLNFRILQEKKNQFEQQPTCLRKYKTI